MRYFTKTLLILSFVVFISSTAITRPNNEQVLFRSLTLLNNHIKLGINLQLSDHHLRALEHGIALEFNYGIAYEDPKKLLFRRVFLHEARAFRLSYQHLNQVYIIETLTSRNSYPSWTEVEYALDKLRLPASIRWPNNDERAYARIWLNEKKLETPLQFETLINGNWHIDTGWIEWQY